MKKIIGLLVFTVVFFGCKPNISENYHMDKKYWDVEDYNTAVTEMQSISNKEEGLPRLSNPETAPVFLKLVDKENASIVLEDKQLGVKHKYEVSQGLFEDAKSILELYSAMDVQDKLVYPQEYVKALDFTLHVELLYFKLGNENIIKEVANPDDLENKSLLTNNEAVVVHNFQIPIDFLAKEDALDKTAINEYATIIDVQYPKLLKQCPNADYSELKSATESVSKKVKSPELKKSLAKLVSEINKLGNKTKTDSIQ